VSCGSRCIFPSHASFLGVIPGRPIFTLSESCATSVQQTGKNWMGSSIQRVAPPDQALTPTAARRASALQNLLPQDRRRAMVESLGGRNPHRSTSGPTCWRETVRALRRGMDRTPIQRARSRRCQPGPERQRRDGTEGERDPHNLPLANVVVTSSPSSVNTGVHGFNALAVVTRR